VKGDENHGCYIDTGGKKNALGHLKVLGVSVLGPEELKRKGPKQWGHQGKQKSAGKRNQPGKRKNPWREKCPEKGGKLKKTPPDGKKGGKKGECKKSFWFQTRVGGGGKEYRGEVFGRKAGERFFKREDERPPIGIGKTKIFSLKTRKKSSKKRKKRTPLRGKN